MRDVTGAPVLFVHALGRGGAAAWPHQSGTDLGRPMVFATRRGWSPGDGVPYRYTFRDEARWLMSGLETPVHLVGHSWSGVMAIEAALSNPGLVLSLLLCEPALLTIAADERVVRNHVEQVRPAFETEITLEEFGIRFSAGWDRREDPATWSSRRRQELDRLRRHEPPWESRIDAARLRELDTPTLVVTSGSIELFETVARHMSAAESVTWNVLGGPAHRPQDSDRFNPVAKEWWRAGETGATTKR